MEPVTHFMTGAVLARTGLNRKAAYTTLAMTLAAEMPDLDTLWSARGPVASFEHHRGITHTLLGLPFDAALVLGAVWLIHRIRQRRALAHTLPRTTNDPQADEPIARPLTVAPVRWPLLYAFTLLALLSHIALDWTNNYGVRPFFPFNPRWYAGSFVFIFEPVLFLILLSALLAPALFGLIAGEVGARRKPFRGRGWAIAALLGAAILWGWRAFEHAEAVALASTHTYGLPADQTPAVPPVLRTFANPSPINPWIWHTIVETPNFYQLATVDTRQGSVTTDPESDIVAKPPTTPATLAAKNSWLGKVYLDWSSWPVVTEEGLAPSSSSNEAPITSVTFRDLRFAYNTYLLEGRRRPPLSGTVRLDSNQHIVGMAIDGRAQH